MSLQSRLAELIAAIGADIKGIPVVRSGRGAPTNAIGKTGDWYLNLINLEVYGPKAQFAPAKVSGLAVNLHPNPSLEDSDDNWTTSASFGGGTGANARTTDRAQDGNYSYHGRIHRINGASSSLYVAHTQGITVATGATLVDPAKVYSVSHRLYTREMQSVTLDPGRIRVYWYKDVNTPASVASVVQTVPAQVPVVGQWVENSFENLSPPSDATQCRYSIYAGNTFANPSEFIMDTDVDSVLLVEGSEIPRWGAPIGNLTWIP